MFEPLKEKFKELGFELTDEKPEIESAFTISPQINIHDDEKPPNRMAWLDPDTNEEKDL
jgi:hypothetical protein